MKKYIPVLIFFLLSLTVYAQNTKPRVGVLDFVGNNISESDALVVGEMFTSELVLSGVYDVVDRKNIESIMKEMDFQLSGCTDSSCALEIGQILSLDKMLYGSINRLGRDFVINVYMIDILTAQIEGTARERFAGIEDSYDIMGVLIAKLIGGSDYAGSGAAASGRKTGTAETAEPESPEASKAAAAAETGSGLVLEAGLGAVIGDYESGIEIEAGGRYMFDSFWGLGLSALIGFSFDEYVAFGISARGYFQFTEDFGMSIGFRGMPEYINWYGGVCVGLYFGDFYVRGGIQVIEDEGFNVVVGYSFRL